MSSMYVRNIVLAMESVKEKTIMVAKSQLTETDIKLIKAFAKENNKNVIFATMQEICFCEDNDILVIK